MQDDHTRNNATFQPDAKPTDGVFELSGMLS